MATTHEPQSFAGLLRRHRVTAGLSQEALAERAGMSTRGLSDLERGRSIAPRLETLSRLAEALGLDAAGRHALIQASGHLARADTSEWTGVPSMPGTNTFTAQHLPGYLTNLIGREQDKAAVAALLREPATRLVTLTGPGGVGKTRLAVKVAAGLVDVCPDGVVFVGLAPVNDATLVLATVAQALGIGEQGELSLLETVLVALRDQQLLLVLDNYEHLLDAAPLVVDLLVGCPDLRILVTSRALLRVAGEHVFIVPPLALPAPAPITSDTSAGWPAVELFVSRAQAVQPRFALSEDNVESIVGVCRELDGLPLALELAAARVNVLPPAMLLTRLRDRLSLLTGGPRDAPERHRALRDTISWSYDLLSEDEQRLFRWLGVFAGGWSLQSAEAVCGKPAGGPSVLDGLTALVEHSLVQVQVGGEVADAPRFHLLETIREHALERLTASGEAATARMRHAAALLELVEAAEPHVVSADRERWLRGLDLELDNIHAALVWSLTPEGDPELGRRLVGSLAWFWCLRGYLHEGVRRAEQLLDGDATAATTPGWARALFTRGGFSLMLGDAATSRPYLEQCVARYRAADDGRLPQGLTVLGMAQASLGEPSAALAAYRESVALTRAAPNNWLEAYTLTIQGATMARVGDATAADELYRAGLTLFSRLNDPWGRAIALRGLAGLALAQADPTTAQALYEEALPIFRHSRDARGLAQTLLGLGKAAMRRGSATYACKAFGEALISWRGLGIWAGVVRCLSGLAWVAAAEGRVEQATRLYAAADAYAQVLGVVFASSDVAEVGRTLDKIRSRLEGDRFAKAWACGEAMTFEQAITDALHPDLAERRAPQHP